MKSAVQLHRHGHEAMATRFELITEHEDILLANAIAHDVFRDITQLEKELSRFISSSDVARINRARAGESVAVDAACLDCLSIGRAIWQETGGAFDVTIGPLYRILRHPDGSPRKPSKAELTAATAATGFEKLEIDLENARVTPTVEGVEVDLGAIGKGYALDQARINLVAAGVADALLNAGESTVLAMGNMPGKTGWMVRAASDEPICLQDCALSGTGYIYNGAHIIDPRKQRLAPLARNFRWALAPEATVADALSTAFMVLSQREISAYAKAHPGIRAFHC